MNFVTLIATASAPSLAIMIYVYWRDKFDKEPLTLLARSFFLGVLSAGVAIVLQYAADYFFPFEPGGYFTSTAIKTYLKVGLSEEWAKFILLYLFIFPNKNFDEPYDGITYAVMISMGFASFENVLYMVRYGNDVIYLRALTAVPAHATFAIGMGYYVGLAKFSKFKNAYLVLGLLVATLMHGTYDFFLFLDRTPYLAFGAMASLILGIIWSLKAIRKHANLSKQLNELDESTE